MKLTVKDLVLMALYAALFLVLDVVSNALPKMPNGGSLGLGIIPLLMASYHLGWKKGLFVGLLSIPLQYMTGQVWFVGWGQFLLDYVLAFGIYGIACIFPNKKYFYSGVVVTNLLRFICVVLSGIWYWEVPFWPSVTYNATYMVPTLIATVVLVPLIHQRLERVM